MLFTIQDVRNEFNFLDKKTGFYTGNIEIALNNRLKTVIAQGVFEIDKDDKLNPIKLEVSRGLLNANISPKVFKEIVRHEYAHLWANKGLKEDCGHNGVPFLMVCSWFKCYDTEELPYKRVTKKIESYYTKEV